MPLALIADNPDAQRLTSRERVVRRLRFADWEVRRRAMATNDADRAARYIEVSNKIGIAMRMLEAASEEFGP